MGGVTHLVFANDNLNDMVHKPCLHKYRGILSMSKCVAYLSVLVALLGTWKSPHTCGLILRARQCLWYSCT
ncbi:hypothetical protein EI94DRAFT_1736257 [Lactarius quietus]|nr:hypothetical protein EI94DRAFT_1736257 [Lactarius quietus]